MPPLVPSVVCAGGGPFSVSRDHVTPRDGWHPGPSFNPSSPGLVANRFVFFSCNKNKTYVMNLPCLQCFGSGPRVNQDSTGPMDSDPDSEIPQRTRSSRKEEKHREIYLRAGCSPLEGQRFFKCVLFEGLIRKIYYFLFFSHVHYF